MMVHLVSSWERHRDYPSVNDALESVLKQHSQWKFERMHTQAGVWYRAIELPGTGQRYYHFFTLMPL